jgi:tetratricopeptide (TPR) repeat protein
MSARRILAGISVLLLVSLAGAGCQTVNGRPAPPVAKAQPDLRKDQRTRELYLSIIAQLEQYEKYHAALAHIDEFERIYGTTPRSRGLRADAWLAIGELAKAETEYTAIVRGPLSGEGLHGLGRVAASQRDWSNAVTYFEQAVHEQPTNTRFLDDLGRAYSEVGRSNDAEFTFKKAGELSSVSPDTGRLLSDPKENKEPVPVAPVNQGLSMSLTGSSEQAPSIVESGPNLDGIEPGQ